MRPDIGCGCFGDFSTAPVSGRTIARSALLAAAALSTIGLPARRSPADGRCRLGAARHLLCVELLVVGALSPEVGEGLIRLGYSEPCELRDVPSERTMVALRRSKQWRRIRPPLASDTPVDVWRELCWRYVVYPSSYPDRQADLVFAVYLQHRRPVIHAALVDSGTGLRLPWPTGSRPGGRQPDQGRAGHGRPDHGRQHPGRALRGQRRRRCRYRHRPHRRRSRPRGACQPDWRSRRPGRRRICRYLLISSASARQAKIPADATDSRAATGQAAGRKLSRQAGWVRRNLPKCGTVNAIRPRSEL